MSSRWVMGLRGRPDRIRKWWALGASGDLDKAIREFHRELAEDRQPPQSQPES